MNIREAKQEIINTVRAYMLRDDAGMPLIPYEKQRPILMMGPPGIGKTAIMQQVAAECGIGLTAYTITHHTRQSAVGLPFIAHKVFDGKDTPVTEYTMSEIIASVYNQIEHSGIRQGILFLDEINCVSETLAPTMLQFLQYKTFGTHRLPEGYIIVAAGNPPQYNRSVRDFDIVTLDRVRKIQITEDLEAFRDYARSGGIHGAIMAYLEIHSENFYRIRADIEEQYFVTARGWEDLSGILRVYEKLGIPLTREVTAEYLQDPAVAEEFTSYYQLYRKYSETYCVPDILEGRIPEQAQLLRNAPFDEKVSLIGLITDAMHQECREYAAALAIQMQMREKLLLLRAQLSATDEMPSGNPSGVIHEMRSSMEESVRRQTDAGMLGHEEKVFKANLIRRMQELEDLLAGYSQESASEAFAAAKEWFGQKEDARILRNEEISEHLTNCFRFLSQVFGEGQEMVLFLTEINARKEMISFITDCGNDAYYKYNRLLLLGDTRAKVQEEIRKLMIEG